MYRSSCDLRRTESMHCIVIVLILGFVAYVKGLLLLFHISLLYFYMWCCSLRGHVFSLAGNQYESY